MIHFTDLNTGTIFDGCHGWRNTSRAIRLAMIYRMTLDTEEITAVEAYESGDADDEQHEMVVGQGELCDRATDHLREITASGLEWVWDMGELSLIPACLVEDEPLSPAECDHCERAAIAANGRCTRTDCA